MVLSKSDVYVYDDIRIPSSENVPVLLVTVIYFHPGRSSCANSRIKFASPQIALSVRKVKAHFAFVGDTRGAPINNMEHSINIIKVGVVIGDTKMFRFPMLVIKNKFYSIACDATTNLLLVTTPCLDLFLLNYLHDTIKCTESKKKRQETNKKLNI